jgi:hypothetical protein
VRDTRRFPLLALALLVAPAPLVALAPVASADAFLVSADWTVSSAVELDSRSLVIGANIIVTATGSLTLNDTHFLMRVATDGEFGIFVLPGGSLSVLNGSSIGVSFVGTAYVYHFSFLVYPGAHFTLRDSWIDGAFGVGVGDENATLQNSSISRAYFGLYGYNLTADGLHLSNDGIGFWLSGHSRISNATVTASEAYGGLLDDTSAVIDSDFAGSFSADIVLSNSSLALSTTHRASTRGIITYGSPTIDGGTFADLLGPAIQFGHESFTYLCSLVPGAGSPFRLNLHDYPLYYRLNNTVTVRDITVNGPQAFDWGRSVWRQGEDNPSIFGCPFDPPANGAPLWNNVTWTVTRPTTVSTWGVNVFNGTIVVERQGSLTIEGGEWDFQRVEARPVTRIQGELNLRSTIWRSTLENYTNDTVDKDPAVTANIDAVIDGGSVVVEDSLLMDLGNSPDPAVDAGFMLEGATGSLRLERTTVRNSTRLMTTGCCGSLGPTATIANSTVAVDASAVVMNGGRADLVACGAFGSAGPAVWAASGSSELRTYGCDVPWGGPGNLQVARHEPVRVRALWPDLHPVAGARVSVTELSGGALRAAGVTGSDGRTPWFDVLVSTTLWDGTASSGGAIPPFEVRATYGANAAAQTFDFSSGGDVSLTVPDGAPPVVVLDLPAVMYTNQSTYVISGSAEDQDCGLTLLEFSLDGNDFLPIAGPFEAFLGVFSFSNQTPDLPDGNHPTVVRATDCAGNSAEARSWVVVDLVGPEPEFEQTAPLITSNRTVIISGTLNEPGTVESNGASDAVELLGGRFSMVVTINGTPDVLTVTARDLAGNAVRFNFDLKIDEVAPSLYVNSPGEGSTLASVSLDLAGSCERNASLELNGVRLAPRCGPAFAIPLLLSEGENRLILAAIDEAGNRAVVAITVYLDSAEPVFDLVAPDPANPLASRSVDLLFRVTPGCDLTIGGSTWHATGPLLTVKLALPEGRTLLPVVAVSASGTEFRRSFAFVVDTVAPPIDLDRGEHASVDNATVRVAGVTEPYARVFVGGLALQANSGGQFFVVVQLHGGLNQIEVRAVDAAGNANVTSLDVMVVPPATFGPPGPVAPGPFALGVLAAGAIGMVAALVAVRPKRKDAADE